PARKGRHDALALRNGGVLAQNAVVHDCALAREAREESEAARRREHRQHAQPQTLGSLLPDLVGEQRQVGGAVLEVAAEENRARSVSLGDLTREAQTE